nr:DNA repair exonuclease [uncultured Sellimonas sp.]
MKFVHTADVHLGVRPDAGKAYTDRRPREIWESFERLLTFCEENKVDLLLIVGDLFHRQPLLKELKEVSSLFDRLTHTKVVLTAGNHDYVKADSHYRKFRWGDNVYPLFSDRLEKAEFPELKTAVSGFSYQQKEIRNGLLASWKCKRSQENEILLLHGGDEKHLPFRKREVRQLGYDYTALGHIHKADRNCEENSLYSGALEPTDPNDTGQHGFVLGTAENGVVYTRFVPFAGREYIHTEILVDQTMNGKILEEEIRKTIEEDGRENMYRITLTGFRDPDIEFAVDLMDPYGNIIDIIDMTNPSYDFEKLERKNRDNLLGKYIRSFQNAGQEDELLEEMALYEGVRAILETRKG